MSRNLQLTAEDMTDLAAGHTINVEDNAGYELIVGADNATDYKQLFVDLFTAVAACEAPAGTQVDDVLGEHQEAFDKATNVGRAYYESKP